MSPRLALRVAICAIATAAAACVGKYHSDFPIVVVNKATNAISVQVNGSEIGQVAVGQSANFNVTLQETNSNTFSNGVAPTPQADVVITAKDMKTGALSATKNITLTQSPPTYVTFANADFPSSAPTIARFTVSPTNPGVNQDVFFNASSSSATNATYTWDFGDGMSGSGVSTTHRYPLTGTFTVVLVVTSDNGQTSTSSRSVSISAGLPPNAANFTFSPTAPGVNQNVVFTATNVPGATFGWDFGDGSNGAGTTVTHAYTRAGTFSVTMRVSNDLGQSATTSRTITVSATLPAGTAAFTFSPTDPHINDTVFFNATASAVTNGTYRWDFGDGSTGTGVTPTHVYTRANTFTVTLTVLNDIGQAATVSHTVTVADVSFTVDFTFSPTNPTHGSTLVRFDASASGPNVATYSWDYGDGTTDTGARPSHTFANAGTYVVRLTISDANGRTATTTKTVPVS